MKTLLAKVTESMVFKKGSKVLDINSTDASLTIHLAKKARGTDFYYRPETDKLSLAIRNAEVDNRLHNLRLRTCPSDRLSFKDHSVSTIINFLPVRYNNPVTLVKEFRRVLIDGGEVVIIGPHPDFGKIVFECDCPVAIEKLPHVAKDQIASLFAAMKGSFMSYRITDIKRNRRFHSQKEIFEYINNNFDSSYLDNTETAMIMAQDLAEQVEKFGSVEVDTSMRMTKAKHDF